MKHPNTALLEKVYSDFAKHDFHRVLDACSDNMTFQVPGKSRLAGKYTKVNFVKDFASKLLELSGGTFQLEVHDILASDQHAAVLSTHRLHRPDGNDKTIEYRSVHIWRRLSRL